VEATGRRGELGLVEERRHELVRLLERVWPGGAMALAALTARGLRPPRRAGARSKTRSAPRPVFAAGPSLNRRTVAALVAPHSKATLTERRLAALGDAEATHDGSVRLRPPRGLRAHSSKGTIDLSGREVFGEVSLPERAL
jgi:hypothetical protein